MKTAICKNRDCRLPFVKSDRNRNQKYCPECMTHNNMRRGFRARLDEIERAADNSGNARVWNAGDGWSQEFLKGLVPSLKIVG